MRKMTPMILVILMLASVLSSIDVYELQEQNEFEETSARAGADPEVVYVTSPRETTTAAGGGVINELLAGEPVNFKAYLRNSGDADLTNMQYQVNVYVDDQGQRGDLATDSNGNNLAWTNDKAVCANNCQNSVLAAGEYIDGGESTLVTTSGTVIEWIPAAGNYFIEVKVTSQALGDPGNDEISYKVSAKDYHDIQMDVTWLDDDGNEVAGAIEGNDDVDFKVTLELVSSVPGMTIRNATVTVDMTGGSVDGSSSVTEILGNQQTVPISEDEDGNSVTDVRMIIGASDAFTGSGPIVGESVMTLSAPADGDYSVSVTIQSYTLYEVSDTCSGSNVMCERTIAGTDAEDEFSGNNMGSIYGSATTIHDIKLTDYYLSPVDTRNTGDKGDDESSFDDRYGFIGGDISDTLSVGIYDMFAVVQHTSSSNSPVYEWNVTFTIYDLNSDTSTEVEATECAAEDYPTHTFLGVATDRTPDSQVIVFACAQQALDVGDYDIKATANLLGDYDESTSTVDERLDDMILGNNEYSYTVSVRNYAPSITSLKSESRLGLVGGSATFDVDAFDVEGDRLTYSWYDGSGAELCPASSDAACTVTLTDLMVPTLTVRVEVSDGYNTVDESTSLEVASELTFAASGLADGFNSVYEVRLKASGLDVTFADGDLSPVDIDSCANTPTPVGAVTVNPSTTYDSSVVMSQTLDVHFPSDLNVKYMWMEIGSTVVSVASGDGVQIDASTSGYTYEFPQGSDMVPAGTTFYLIADECDTPEPPAGAVTQLTANAAKGGDVVISYNYDSLLSDENVRIEVTLADGTTPEITYDRIESDTRSITWSSGTDGQAYTVSAKLCNLYSCGDALTASVTSDASVAAVTATSITISESGDNWVVDWDVSAVDDDIAGWYVCYNKGEFTANEMQVLIDAGACQMVSDATEATIAKYTTVETTQVHFGIVPYDAVMNIAYGPSTDSILYDRAQDTTNPDDGTTTTDSEASSGVPTWTWGVIGAVVVVAFIVGAFILSRGEGEDDDDKEWDY